MESFWGKMKCEWLYDKHFKIHQEACEAVFQYIELLYNRQRIHASNGYLTPKDYYKANKELKII